MLQYYKLNYGYFKVYLYKENWRIKKLNQLSSKLIKFINISPVTYKVMADIQNSKLKILCYFTFNLI